MMLVSKSLQRSCGHSFSEAFPFLVLDIVDLSLLGFEPLLANGARHGSSALCWMFRGIDAWQGFRKAR